MRRKSRIGATQIPRHVPVMYKVVYSLVLYGKLIYLEVCKVWLYQGRGCAVVPVMG